MATVIMRPGILDNIKMARGIKTDEALAKIGGVSLNTYKAYRDGLSEPSGRFLSNIGTAFGLSIGELAMINPALPCSSGKGE